MSLATASSRIRRVRSAVAASVDPLIIVGVLILLAVVAFVMMCVWAYTGDPTVHPYIVHSVFIPTAEFHGGMAATDLGNGQTALAFGDTIKTSFPWLLVACPVVAIASLIGAGLCYTSSDH